MNVEEERSEDARERVAIPLRWSAAKRSWPGVRVPDDVFRKHVMSHVGPAGTVPPYIGDLYLACACAQGDPVAVRFFDRQMLLAAQSVVRSIDARMSFVDEVIRRVRMRLLVTTSYPRRPMIAQFGGRESLATWVRMVAVKVALVLIREQQRFSVVTGDRWASAVLLPDCDDSSLQKLKQAQFGPLADALAGASVYLAESETAVLRLHILGGLDEARLCSVFGLNRTKLQALVRRASKSLLERAKQIVAKTPSMKHEDEELVAQLLERQLELGLCELLPEAKPRRDREGHSSSELRAIGAVDTGKVSGEIVVQKD